MRILLIHGRAQGGKDVANLEQLWLEALRKGCAAADRAFPDRLAVDFPFYGDKLDELEAQAALPTSDEVATKGPGQNRDYEEFLASALVQMKEAAGIEDDEVKKLLEGQVTEKGMEHWGWVQGIARFIDQRAPGVVDFMIEDYLRDVYLYVNNRVVRRTIDTIVEQKLTKEPTLVVGHSLGSVVGYNVVVGHQADLDLLAYVTVGSPLGLRAISSKLGIPENPRSANGWYNAYDDRDIVALNPLDAKHFDTDPPIVNNGAVANHTDNHHGIVGYLDDASIAARIVDVLSRPRGPSAEGAGSPALGLSGAYASRAIRQR